MVNIPDPVVVYHQGSSYNQRVVNFCEEPDQYNGDIPVVVSNQKPSMVKVPETDKTDEEPKTACTSILRAPQFIAFVEKELAEVTERIKNEKKKPVEVAVKEEIIVDQSPHCSYSMDITPAKKIKRTEEVFL